ncbi:recombinase family protein [Clostridioides difficile]|uniref:recombinase family protein n=1 Tax=Clostridioides difficile TaxID=1496 RepID=UPI001C1CFC58|nr:recombinase family protein [Clostridioides difficile]HBF6291365.1 recombinase family protein [Clostridioides difficile]HBG4071405.1 recombinase family protein [Clostridioides difficile]HBY2690093.1 recombinase family protein [Clostridioides difficile]HDO9121445.1 recombinase family protein [Clostridioides difficile]
MTVYGYARISTKTQKIARQIENIKGADQSAVIIEEAYTGTKLDRPQFTKLLKVLKEGDTIIFDSVSRMSRDASEGFKLYEELYNKGINLVFIKEPHINTDTYKKALSNNVEMTGGSVDAILRGINEYLMLLAKEQILIAFNQSQKEVDDLRQRTKEGIKQAQINGAIVGIAKGTKLTTKKSIEAKELIKKYSRDFNGTNTDVEAIKLVGCSRNSYYKYKRELLDELEEQRD